MHEAPKASTDVRVRNVRLHSRGKTENGTLYLTKHHLIFSYFSDAKIQASADNRTSGIGSRIASANYLSPDCVEKSTSAETSSNIAQSPTPNQRDAKPPQSDAASNGEPHGDSNNSKGPLLSAQSRPRPKEIWVPYPMINHGVLRPSHFQSQTLRLHEGEPADSGESADDGFPPLYGTGVHTRPSTDSGRSTPYSSPQRPAPTGGAGASMGAVPDSGRSPTIRIRRRDFQMMAFHFYSSPTEKNPEESAREVFHVLRNRCCVDRIEDMHAFHFKPPQEEVSAGNSPYDARREFARMGIGSKAAEGPGSAWRVTDINHEYSFSKTYPNMLCVPVAVSDNLLKYGGPFRSRSRIPALTYLHSNGGSITRSSQPMVGVQNKRNPQDERLVSAIFSSHTPPLQSPEDSPTQRSALTSPSTSTIETTASDPAVSNVTPALRPSPSDTVLDEKAKDQSTVPPKKVYGSTRRNLIVDARPKINALANRATGGGMEDISNYTGPGDISVDKMFLNIANIHVMRASLEKVMESFANSDYLDIKPNQELLRKSAWLSHISNLLDGAETIARVVGLGGSHVLVHCSDGWDRTSQVAAIAQIMLDPFYRSLNGFITLVQKDFLSFGHKFQDRHGIEGSEKWFEIEHERVNPSRTRDASSGEANSLNAFSSKAISGAKTWFEKNRSNIFRQQNGAMSNLGDGRAPSPPPNSILHSPPVAIKEEKEHKTRDKEMAPIFHQFLDAVFQLLYHKPDAFEFNERFLRRLFYQAHSGQYGEFLFNTEDDRSRHQEKTHSVWAHFLSRRHEFHNPNFVAQPSDPLLFPQRQGIDQQIEVRWWSTLFGRKDEDMNTPRSLAPPDPEPEQPGLSTHTSSLTLSDTDNASAENLASELTPSNTSGDFKNFQSLERVRVGLSSTWQSLRFPTGQQPSEAESTAGITQSTSTQQGTDTNTVPKPTSQDATTSDVQREEPSNTPTQQSSHPDGDPFGVNKSVEVQDVQYQKSAFAAFSQRTYSSK